MLRARFLLSESLCLYLRLLEDALRSRGIPLALPHRRSILEGDQLPDHVQQLI